MEPVLLTLGSLYALWALYLAAMALDRARRAGALSLPAKVLGYPLALFAFAFDVAVNLTLGTLLLLDRPREWTLSERLTRLGNGPAGWRRGLARFVCTRLLDTFDPTGRHCDCADPD
jgi:hypothetical protein